MGEPEIEAGALHEYTPAARVPQVNLGVNTMTKFVREFVRNESGAAAAEYALILAIVGAAIALAAISLGGVIANAMNSAGTCISSKGVSC